MTLYRVPGAGGNGSFIGLNKEADGTLRRLEGWEYNAYLAGGNEPVEISQDWLASLIDAPDVKVSGEIPSEYLSDGARAAWSRKAGTIGRTAAAIPAGAPNAAAGSPSAPAASAPAATPAAPAGSPEFTSLLAKFGIDYPNAPAPTPQMLAFMRGLGMSLDTVTDTRDRTKARLQQKATDSVSDIDRGNERTKTNMMADMVRRGVLSSGEANTRYGQQAENVADQKSQVTRNQAEGFEQADSAWNQVRDSFRQTGLERVLGAEEQEATRKATNQATTDAIAAQEAADERAYKRQKESQESYIAAQEALYKKYGVGAA